MGRGVVCREPRFCFLEAKALKCLSSLQTDISLQYAHWTDVQVVWSLHIKLLPGACLFCGKHLGNSAKSQPSYSSSESRLLTVCVSYPPGGEGM